MSTIVTRSGKGSPLTHAEVDANFNNLNSDKSEKSSNLSDLTSASTARTNLGLGTAATVADSTLVHTSGNETIGGTKTFSVDASISGLTVGKGLGSITTNSVVGLGALAANTSGLANTAMGSATMASNTTGGYNSAYGRNALGTNTTGSNNTALGYNSLVLQTTGGKNTAVGDSALFSNTTADNNTAVGYQAGYSNLTGTRLTALGYGAGYASTADSNTFIGGFSAYATTSGTENSALGDTSLRLNTTGSYNVAVGKSALFSNTTASNGTAVGYQAGYTYTGGSNSQITYVGYQAGLLCTNGSNTFIGYGSGSAMTTGGANTILGMYTGNQGGLDIRTANNYIVLSDGAGNPRGIFNSSGIFITGGAVSEGGIDVGSSTNPGVAIYGTTGAKGIITVQNNNDSCMYMSKASGYTSGIYVKFYVNSSQVGKIETNGSTTSYVTTSDYRLKENVVPMTGALAKVSALKPVTYKWKTTGDAGQGFIAHELQEICPDAVSGEKDALDKDGNIQPQGIDTSFLVATLVSAIQELKAEVDSLKQQLGK